MKYEFHTGDYVETKNGEIGYITEVAFTNEVKRWCSMRVMCRQNNSVISFDGHEDTIPDRFNRIGRYDFAKKDTDKIKPLLKSWADSEGKFHINLREIIEKINELVSAVNELRENK
mgnify:CR=1 FL=1